MGSNDLRSLMRWAKRSISYQALLCTTAGVSMAAEAPIAAVPLNSVATNLPGVRALPSPPRAFNPLTASPQELETWGYPPRPSASEGPEALSRWSEAVSRPVKRVVPELKKREGVFHHPAIGLKLVSKGEQAVNMTSSNWSGYAMSRTGSTAKQLYTVAGRWTVPTVQQTPGTCSGGWDYSAQWVGLGGFTDDFLLQAGSEADVWCDVGNNVTEYYPWFEWLPNSEIVIYQNSAKETTYPFQPGDYLIVYVWATNWSSGASTTGKVLFEDVTQDWSISLTFSAASVGGSKVTGQSAEWIVERPLVNGSLAILPDYTANPWWYTLARDLGGNIRSLASTGSGYTVTNVTMLDDNGNPVSYADYLGPYSLWFFPEGSAAQ